MIRRGSGDIINISSLAGKNTFARWRHLLRLQMGCPRSFRLHGGRSPRTRIRVSVICPGSVATDFSGRGAKDASKVLSPEDVAHAVEAIVTQGPRSFLSEIHLRPLRKP